MILIAYQFYNEDLRYWRGLNGIHEEGDCQSPLQCIFLSGALSCRRI